MRAIRRLGEAERQHASADAASLRWVADNMDRDAHAEEAQENLELADAHSLGALFKRNRSLVRLQRDANQIRLVAVQEEQRAAREENDAALARLDAEAIERAGEARYQMRIADADALRDLSNGTVSAKGKASAAPALFLKVASEEQRRTAADAASLRIAAEQEGKDANNQEARVLSEMADVRALKALLAQNRSRQEHENLARDAEQIQNVAVKEVQRAAKEETEALYTSRDADAVARAGQARAQMASLGAGALKRLSR
jgi:hypothetical protein